jgi:N-acetylglucosaminyl-diphospho-decaprenol L-rhamnosyltransferase
MLEQTSIIIPSFNSLAALQTTILTLHEHVPEAEIIVVDGGSTDGSLQWVAQQKTIRLLEVKNHGYGHALNRGCEIASNELFILMNSDVLIAKNALQLMQKRLLEKPEVAAVGVVPLQPNGKKQNSFGLLAGYYSNYFTIQKPRQVNVLHGYCIATRRDVLEKVGGFDENFFFYNEELDWCRRVRKAGFSLEILPETAIHLGGSSTVQSPEIMFEGHRGGMYFVVKHFPPWQVEVVRGLFVSAAWIMGLIERRLGYQRAWQQLGDCIKRRSYLESPFPLSGRGVVSFRARSGTQSVEISKC